jgi:putative hydrolase of the HAD superfamily
MPVASPQALLFDLGGVVTDIDFDRALHAWSAISPLSLEQLRRAFQFDDHYQRHERGEISAERYFEHLIASLQLTGTVDQVAAGWNSIFVGEIAETKRLIQLARDHLPCFALTNTNATHQQAWSLMFPDVMSLFDRVFASHEIGYRKPEPMAFKFIAREIGQTPDSIVFFDDLAENVDGARLVGLQAVQVRSPTDVQLALRGIGIAI